MFKRMGGVKGFLNNFQKTALFSRDGFPKYESFCTLSILLNKNTKPKYEYGQVGAAHRGGGFA